jgi:hypothetical protein
VLNRTVLALAAILVAAGCSGAVTESPSASIVNPQGDGVTVQLDNPAGWAGTLAAGTYRLAWWAPDCSELWLNLKVDLDWTENIETSVTLPGGQRTIVNVPAGPALLENSYACGNGHATIRLERMP